MAQKKVLIVGSGGREHALGWKISESSEVSEVFYAPGNAGTEEGKGRNISIDGTDKNNFPALLDFVIKNSIDMVVVGPEKPLNAGITDFFNSQGFTRIFGPTRVASQLEADKFYSYDLMERAGIPQAKSIKCFSVSEAEEIIKREVTAQGIVIKARGLTGGKGVSVCDNLAQALAEIPNFPKKFGPDVLIAKRLFGQEYSVFGISDGENVSPLEMSIQDHKRLRDGDQGPNTGGMGAYCPAPIASAEAVRDVAKNIMTPIVRKMKAEGAEYKGFLYAGMIMTVDGPKVIEFNVRFGDPECEPAMMMIESDLYRHLSDALDGKLDSSQIRFKSGAACSVILSAQTYPEAASNGLPISGLEDTLGIAGVKVFHAGTKKDNGKVVTAGGRILAATAYSEEGILAAKSLAYEAVRKINMPGGFHYRTDISDKALI